MGHLENISPISWSLLLIFSYLLIVLMKQLCQSAFEYLYYSRYFPKIGLISGGLGLGFLIPPDEGRSFLHPSWVGTPKGANTLARPPPKLKHQNAFGLLCWPLRPQKKTALLFWRCPLWLSGVAPDLISNAFKGILSQAKTSSGKQITHVFLLIARNNPWVLLRYSLIQY